MLVVGGVGEVEHSVLLQRSSRYNRIHQRVVKVQIVYRQGHPTVSAADHHATPTVVVVLVPHVDDDAAVHHLNWLQTGKCLRGQCQFLVSESLTLNIHELIFDQL